MVNPKLDAIDRTILKLLQADGRLSNVDLAAKVQLLEEIKASSPLPLDGR